MSASVFHTRALAETTFPRAGRDHSPSIIRYDDTIRRLPSARFPPLLNTQKGINLIVCTRSACAHGHAQAGGPELCKAAADEGLHPGALRRGVRRYTTICQWPR